jgi:non-specific serine/threonine protein kinase
VRKLGRFELRQLLGKSSLTMAWLAYDPRARAEVMLMLPRHAPPDEAGQQAWLTEVRRIARLEHPRVLPVVEAGVIEHFPYLACERRKGLLTLAEVLASGPRAPVQDMAGWWIDALEGLAFVHDAGHAHGDLTLHAFTVDAAGRVASWGFGVAVPEPSPPGKPAAFGDDTPLREQRAASERDLMAAGLLLHGLLANAPALDEPDIAHAVRRAPQEIVRLPWNLPQPVPDALRAIVNRACERHAHRRYLGARSFMRALDGWRRVYSDEKSGAMALLIDRLRSVGHLPTRPGLAHRIAGLLRMEQQRLDELADVVLQDTSLAFELLRTVNGAAQGEQASGPVSTVRRAMQLIGLAGVRRAASGLRAWPGPLNEAGARALDRGLRHARIAANLAAELSPGGLDAEAAYLAAQLQHLGRLLALYHFPEESVQIQQLTQAMPAATPGEAAVPGMDERAAAMAVLGVDLDALADALARHWGLAESMQSMLRPLSADQPVRAPDNADAWIRLVASCANEVLAVALLPPAQQMRALGRVAARYHNALELGTEQLRDALVSARRRADDDIFVAHASAA